MLKVHLCTFIFNIFYKYLYGRLMSILGIVLFFCSGGS